MSTRHLRTMTVPLVVPLALALIACSLETPTTPVVPTVPPTAAADADRSAHRDTRAHGDP